MYAETLKRCFTHKYWIFEYTNKKTKVADVLRASNASFRTDTHIYFLPTFFPFAVCFYAVADKFTYAYKGIRNTRLPTLWKGILLHEFRCACEIARLVFGLFFFNGCGIIVYAWPRLRGRKLAGTVKQF